MSERIEALVARIIDAETLVLNSGWQSGVVEGMRFAVVQPADEVADPADGTPLGRWELVKAVLSVTHVQERMSTAQPVPRDTAEAAALAAAGAAAGAGAVLSAQMIRDSMPRGSADTERARVDPSQTSGRPRTDPIRVGDVVRSIPARLP